LYFGIIK